jgi:hypothetical protein
MTKMTIQLQKASTGSIIYSRAPRAKPPHCDDRQIYSIIVPKFHTKGKSLLLTRISKTLLSNYTKEVKNEVIGSKSRAPFIVHHRIDLNDFEAENVVPCYIKITTIPVTITAEVPIHQHQPHQNCKSRKQHAHEVQLTNPEEKKSNLINIKSKGLILSK